MTLATGSPDRLPSAASILEPSPGALLRRRIFRHAGLTIGGGVLLFILAMAILAPLLAPYDPYFQGLTQRLLPPVWHDKGRWAHTLGPDGLAPDPPPRLHSTPR